MLDSCPFSLPIRRFLRKMTAETLGEEPCGEMHKPEFNIKMNRKGDRE
jgi:hypothetical protein